MLNCLLVSPTLAAAGGLLWMTAFQQVQLPTNTVWLRLQLHALMLYVMPFLHLMQLL